MAGSESADEVETAASIIRSQDQPLPEPATEENTARQRSLIQVLDTSDSTTRERERLSSSKILVNVSSPKKPGPTISNSEQPLGISTAFIDVEHQRQYVNSIPKQGPLGNTNEYTQQQLQQLPEIPAPETVPAVVQGTESTVTTSEPSSALGAPVETAAVLFRKGLAAQRAERALSNAQEFRRRFEEKGNLDNLNPAIFHYECALDFVRVYNDDHPAISNNLGILYLRRFESTGELQDIDRAISHHQSAMESTPSGHATLPRRFNNLGNSYSCRFEHTGDLQDIERAISHHQSAVESTPSGHAALSGRIGNLGNSYLFRFRRIGDLQDVDSAISYHQRAVKSIPPGHADLPIAFNNLGNSYLGRFKRTGDLQDIGHAIFYHQTSVESTPSGHSDLPMRFNNLGNSYLYRFERTGDLQDIDLAISHHQSAVESNPSGHTNLSSLLNNNLGSSYLSRFEHTGDLQNINRAISHHQRAVESTPSDDAKLPIRFNNLGISFARRFERTGELQDIDHSISHHQSAVEATPSGHAGLPGSLNNLGNAYSYRFQSSHHLPDVQKSISSYRLGAQANGAPSDRLQAARRAAKLSSAHGDRHCLVDFALAISLLSEVAGLEQTIHRRHTNLHRHSGFVGSAVAAALRCGRVDLALEWLEQGRCLVWNQLNQLRTPMNALLLKSPSLADRFIKVACALEFHGTRSSSIRSPSSTLEQDICLQDETRNHTLLAADYRQLLKEIRGLPDFHNFLQPPNTTDLLSSLPSNGPVIIFNIHETQCDALALISGIEQPRHIPLEKFSFIQAKRLQEDLRSDLLNQREAEDEDRKAFPFPRNSPFAISLILEELWHKVVQPVLEALGHSSPPNPSDRRRIWWCPTGPLAFLPLHAAGIYGSAYKPGLCISDFVVSSYTPTVHSINEKSSASCTSPKCTNIVLISQPNTPRLSSIPSTRKETHAIKALMDGSAVDTLLLEDANATMDEVKREMKTRPWVHFACHGIQDVDEPLKSGVHLHDGRLELLEIMRQQIKNPDLAFLSACQMSKGDLKLAEEVVHFAAGMLAAGYLGVVGTMWNISDMRGPEFATAFYQYLLEEKGPEGLDSTRAAYALDHAVRKVRESLGEGDAAFLTWVPYVHFGY